MAEERLTPDACGVKYIPNCGPLDKWCGEGNGTPLQYSCLENPMDGGAW